MDRSLFSTAFALLATAAPLSAAMMTFTAIDDATIINGTLDQNINFGSRNEVILGTNNGSVAATSRNALVRWDFSPIAGVVASVNSITLQWDLSMTRDAPTVGQTFNIFMVSDANADWVEGTGQGSGAAAVNADVTYSEKSEGSTAWVGGPGLMGAGGTSGAFGSISVLGNEAQGQTITAVLAGDLDGLVANWSAAGAGAGGLYFTSTAQGPQVFFQSDDTGVGTGARLVVDYEPIPEPSSGFLGLGAGMLLAFRRRMHR